MMRLVVLGFAFALFPGSLGVASDRHNATAAVPRHTTIVYYANETVKQVSDLVQFAKLQAILRRSRSQAGDRLIKKLQGDVELYPQIVERESAALQAMAKRSYTNLAIFSNKLALEGHYLFYDAESDTLQRHTFAIGQKEDGPFIALAPLSRPDVLREALETAVRAASQPVSSVVLFVNSHGTIETALMPRINVDLSIATEDEILQRVRSGSAGEPPRWAMPHGTSKIEFWSILGQISGGQNVRFPLVVRLACQSGLSSRAELAAIPPSVERFAHTGLSSPSTGDIDLAAAFSKAKGTDWLASMPDALRDAGFKVDTPQSLSLWLIPIALRQIPIIVYFLPVFGWFVWIAIRWTRASVRITGSRVHA
jgi:hypothetical protein